MSLNGFNIAAERVDLIMALMMLYLTLATKPKQTEVLSVIFHGEILSVANIVLHTACVMWCANPVFATSIFYKVLVTAYYLTYLGILILLFVYLHLLSIKQRENKFLLHIIISAFALVYLIAVGNVIMNNQYIIITENQSYLSPIFNINIAFGLIDVVMVITTTIVNRTQIPHVLMRYIFIFVPVEVALLLIQLFRPEYIFLSITYVLPFMLCYIMFHSILFDEVTGCQNKSAFESHFSQLKKKHKKFVIIYVKFPRLELADNIGVIDILKRRISAQCRAVEQRNHDARVYMLNDYTFSVIFKVKDEEKAAETVDYIHENLEYAIDHWEFSNSPEYKMIVIRENTFLQDMPILDSYSSYLFEMTDKLKIRFLEATPEDYRQAITRYRIENEIVDIRNKGDLDDDRIVVYAQPIYDVSAETFHNAEALMRLRIGGELISPEVFVPLAERVGCIHTLTRIILNKVCKQIAHMQEQFEFDAISVNVSLSEFMDYSLHNELLGIISEHNIPYNKIRLEITESMTSDEMDAIKHNMLEFNKAGVHFYLDDFGTGYSNLERIVSLPFKTIKFDKTLLYKSEDDPILLQLICNMVEVFKSHDLIVLVEGVETDEQADLSKRIGFEFIQGFNYAQPVPIVDVHNYFVER
ncbi:MAG: EAL domain-containing protein [Pseudobutyrivibrio sp.]|nr:EAL domain-containing protein [Pseudobutyrivibrio sp.]